jgi:hypothetical protein
MYGAELPIFFLLWGNTLFKNLDEWVKPWLF